MANVGKAAISVLIVAVFAALIYACPMFHGNPAPTGMTPLVIVVLVLLVVIPAGLVVALWRS